MFTNVWVPLALMMEQDFVNFVLTPLYSSLLPCKAPSCDSPSFKINYTEATYAYFSGYVIRCNKIFFLSANLCHLI